jgi:Serine dehydrogenase proteinase
MENGSDKFLSGVDSEAGTGMNVATWSGIGPRSEEISEKERKAVINTGKDFAQAVSEDQAEVVPCLLISGQFAVYEDQTLLFENRVRRSCLDVFGYPPAREERMSRINVLLDSQGGMLDSAFKIVLYLSRYAKELDVYVPRRAKSASTLIALGASRIHLSPFGELGPLDTQISNPAHTTTPVSALDCYQSVDYVRRFGLFTIQEGFDRLMSNVGKQVPGPDLLAMAAGFALGCITPMFQEVKPLDFGGWGRSLRIGEQYARVLLTLGQQDDDEVKERASKIAYRLVYAYTHHPFPIDVEEAQQIGLPAEMMVGGATATADRVVELCQEKAFVGFISKVHAEREASIRAKRERSHVPAGDGYRATAPAMANVETPI